MTANVQISKKTRDGTILVLGGESWEEFDALLGEALTEVDADHVRDLFANFSEVEEYHNRPRIGTAQAAALGVHPVQYAAARGY